ncbi:hypothetical protein [Sulfuriferula nivalis]|uniref:hypothetical protein n=1 Tax=Sulfuriferula nivalis TaxID=2675298 RepID=UPI00138955DA|nr:hypothetical protein [Sulfuriferula nivalis]
MSEDDFEPVVLEDPKDRRLRPLFVGRFADLLDLIVERSRYRGEIFPNHQITQHNFVSPSNGILITVPRGDDIDSPHTHPRALRAQSPATAELPQAQRHAA